MLHVAFFWIFLFLTCGYALWRGRRYERISALVCIIASVGSTIGMMVLPQSHPNYSVVQISDLLVDMFVLVAFVVIALVSDRFWPLWAAGLQLTIGLSHLLKAIQPDLLPLAYGAAERFWSYPTLLIIMVGAWRQHQRMTAGQSATVPA